MTTRLAFAGHLFGWSGIETAAVMTAFAAISAPSAWLGSKVVARQFPAPVEKP